MINIGSLGITDMRIGTDKVLYAYVGTTLIYPSYTFYDYIAPTGTTYGNNVILLNKQCTPTFSAKAKFRLLNYVGGSFLGFTSVSDTDDYRAIYPSNRQLHFDIGSQRISKTYSTADDILNKDEDWTFYNYGIYDNVTGTDVLTGTTQATTPSLVQYRINAGQGRFYGVELYENGVLQVDLVPAVRNSDGVAGLYDRIGGGFYTAERPNDIAAYNLYVDANSIWGADVDNYIWLPVYSSLTLKCRLTGQIRNYRNNTIVGSTAATLGSEWRLFYTTNDNTGTYSLRAGAASQSGAETLNVPSSGVPLNTNIELLFYNKNIMLYQNGAFKWEYAGTRSDTITPKQVMLNTRVTKTERIQFYEGDTLIFDGIPKIRLDDGAPGLYDLVGGGFYTSSNPSNIYFDLGNPDYIANGLDSTSGSPRNVWFDTGVVPTKNMCMEVKASNVNFEADANQNIIGCTDTYHFTYLLPRNSTYHISYLRHNGTSAQSASSDFAVQNHPYVAVMWLSGTTLNLKVEGQTFTGATAANTSAPSVPLYLFARNTNGSINQATRCYGGTKIYYIKLYDTFGGNLLHHFVPWINNGEACFKDLVGGAIIHNIGTDTPIYGYDQQT